MNILKKNQIIILVLSFMLITAGYLNFTSNNNAANEEAVADLGDAKLVSTNPAPIEGEENNTAVTNTINTANNNTQTNETDDNTNETEETDSQKLTANDQLQYFVNSKLERDTMYSQMLETYQNMYNGTGATAEQKTEAMKEISKINKIKNGIMIAENLITAKGFEDLVIFVNSDSTNVIIKGKELSPEQIAQIQNIISRELDVGIENIHISTK